MKKTIISCVLFLTAVTAFPQTPMKTAAEAKLSASDLAVKIADRILATTTYEFKNTKKMCIRDRYWDWPFSLLLSL